MDLYGLAELGIAAGTAIMILREVRMITIRRMNAGVQKAKINGTEKFNGLSTILANREQILGQLYKMRDDTIASMKGAPEPEIQKATAAINQRIGLIEKVNDWSPVLEPLAPYIDNLAEIGLKAAERLMKSI